MRSRGRAVCRRYDPIASTLCFTNANGTEHTVKVGENGRLRAVLESGAVDSQEARDIGLPPPEPQRRGGARNKLPPRPGQTGYAVGRHSRIKLVAPCGKYQPSRLR